MHVLFNVLGVLLWVGIIDQLAQLVRWASPAFPELSGTQRLAAETPRQIANAHTLFNVTNTVVFVWFTHAGLSYLSWTSGKEIKNLHDNGNQVVKFALMSESGH